jgi:protein SCO1/2
MTRRAWPDATRLLAASVALAVCLLVPGTPVHAAVAAPLVTAPGDPPRFAPEPVDTTPPAPALDREAALRASQAAIGRRVGDHVLFDRDGRALRLAELRGKPLLVSFVYTGCFQACPAGTRALQQALRTLSARIDAQRFRVVSIGFNQPADSPAAMREFAARHRIDAPNWDFLSAAPADADALARDFGFSYLATPSGFDHVLGLTVVDADGRIAAQLYGESLSAAQIGEALRGVLSGGTGEGAAPAPPQLDIADLIERVRVICTVYDPATGRYRTDYSLVLEIAGGATFALTMLWFFVAEARNRRRGRPRDARA